MFSFYICWRFSCDQFCSLSYIAITCYLHSEWTSCPISSQIKSFTIHFGCTSFKPTSRLYAAWKTKDHTWCRYCHLCINAPMWREKRWCYCRVLSSVIGSLWISPSSNRSYLSNCSNCLIGGTQNRWGFGIWKYIKQKQSTVFSLNNGYILILKKKNNLCLKTFKFCFVKQIMSH